MRKIFAVALLVTSGSLGLAGAAVAGDGCGAGLEGNWIVKQAGDTKSHLKHHLKIEPTGTRRYSVKIKNDDGDVAFKSANDFNLSCSGGKARLSGDVKMGNCMHTLEITYPDMDGLSIKIPTMHGKGDCAGHKDALHEADRHAHKKVASANKRKK